MVNCITFCRMDADTPQKDTDSAVVTSGNNQMIETCSLVLSAKNIAHRISRVDSDNTAIYIDQISFERAQYEIDAYFSENKNWPPPRVVPERGAFHSLLPTLLLAGGLAWFYMITGPAGQSSPWFISGANDADAVIGNGQWYRIITSLTLHADLSHLAGNVLIGAFLIYYFLQTNGPGLGYLAIISSGAAGNYLNDIVHGNDHLSVGFSTAVFALIGMLSINRIVEQRQPFGIRMFVPFMAGAALLAMLGSSGERTDLGAHLFGLTAGFAIGSILATSHARQLRTSSFFQLCCLLTALCLVLFSWNKALTLQIN